MNSSQSQLPFGTTIPSDIIPIRPDPEKPEKPHHTPSQLLYRKNLLKVHQEQKIRIEYGLEQRKEQRRQQKEAGQRRRLEKWLEGPPRRPIGITVPNDKQWAAQVRRYKKSHAEKPQLMNTAAAEHPETRVKGEHAEKRSPSRK
jgi:hypothetical protein